MSDDEDLTGRLRAGLAHEGAAVVPHADVADLTDRIATRSRRNQRVLSVAAAVLLIAGVATGVAVGRNTGNHTTTQTAATQPKGAAHGLAPGASGGTNSMMAGPEVGPGSLTKVLTRTSNGVTLPRVLRGKGHGRRTGRAAGVRSRHDRSGPVHRHLRHVPGGGLDRRRGRGPDLRHHADRFVDDGHRAGRRRRRGSPVRGGPGAWFGTPTSR